MSILASYRSLFRGRLPGQAVIQVTTRCNARCVQCGMRVDRPQFRHSLEPETVDRILDAVARLNMQAVSFTGGEPLLDFPRLTAMIRRARKLGISYIRTGTNGFIFQRHQDPDFGDRMKRMADELLESGIRNFWISLDSCDPAIHEHNRGLPGVVQGMAKALPLFHRQGLYPSVNLGINRMCGGHLPALTGPFDPQAFRDGFVEAFRRFFSFAVSMGFTIANCCYPMSDESEAVYQATSTDPFIHFTPEEKLAMLQALAQVVPEFRSRIRLFTPMSSLDALMAQALGHADQTYPCRGGLDFLFIDARQGHAYPCGYRSQEDLGPLWTMERLPDSQPDCRRCDWECFRDPSELLGPFGLALTKPLEVLQRFRHRPDFFRLWVTDLRYYLACDTFDGTRPMRPEKLARFVQAGEGRTPAAMPTAEAGAPG